MRAKPENIWIPGEIPIIIGLIMKINGIPALLLLFALMAGCFAPVEEASSAGKPNILILLTDDQRFDAVAELGNNEISTPNMDNLVRSGITFTHTHIMGALGGAVCMPSRGMLMTGKTLYQMRQDASYIPPEDIMIPEHFRASGYTTFGTGKWHNGRESYDRCFSDGDNIFFGGMHRYETDGHFKPFLNHYDVTGEYPEEKGFWGEKFSSIYYADAAVKFLEKQADTEAPFFAYVSFTSPHDPRTPPEEYGFNYTANDVSLPENFKPQHPFDNGEMKIRDEVLAPHPRTEEAVRGEIASYYGMISEVDYQIGRILTALRDTGNYENTIIVFAGDNGLAVGQHGLLGKQNLYDHSIRVPLVISGPGIPENSRDSAYCYLLDVFPTLCDLAGLEIPASVSGLSILPAIKGESGGRPHLFSAYADLQRGIRKDEFKLILYNVEGKITEQLFNIREDPLELKNLAEKDEWKEKQAELRELLKNEMISQGDFCELEKENWGHGPQRMSWEERKAINP